MILSEWQRRCVGCSRFTIPIHDTGTTQHPPHPISLNATIFLPFFFYQFFININKRSNSILHLNVHLLDFHKMLKCVGKETPATSKTNHVISDLLLCISSRLGENKMFSKVSLNFDHERKKVKILVDS